MMTTVASASTRQSSGKLGSPGEYVTGLDELVQAVDVLFGTPEGSVPGRPSYGFRVLELVDLPVTEVQPIFMREARRALVVNEPRAILVSVEVLGGDQGPGQIIGRVNWKPAAGGVTQTTEVSLG